MEPRDAAELICLIGKLGRLANAVKDDATNDRVLMEIEAIKLRLEVYLEAKMHEL